MASFLEENVRTLCRLSLEQFVNARGPAALPLAPEASLAEITAIAVANLSAGRLDRQNRFRAPSEQLTLPAYLERLITLWAAECPRWRHLRAKENHAWRALEQDLTGAAQRLLRNRPPAGSAASTAEDYVQRACLNILRYDYHFDVPLRLWTYAVLRNVIREPDRSHDELDRWHYSLDAIILSGADEESLVLPGEYIDPAAEMVFEHIGQREAVLTSLDKLTTLRQAVLILSFFDDLADADIAKRLDISMSHLYSSRHRALKQMSKLLQTQELQEQGTHLHSI